MVPVFKMVPSFINGSFYEKMIPKNKWFLFIKIGSKFCKMVLSFKNGSYIRDPSFKNGSYLRK